MLATSKVNKLILKLFRVLTLKFKFSMLKILHLTTLFYKYSYTISITKVFSLRTTSI